LSLEIEWQFDGGEVRVEAEERRRWIGEVPLEHPD
jgi:hypothetical protein